VIDAPSACALSLFFTLLPLWAPSWYRRRRNLAILTYRMLSLIRPSMRQVLQAMPAGQTAAPEMLPLTLFTCSGGIGTLSLTLGSPLPIPLSVVLAVLKLARDFAEGQRMCRLPYLTAAHPERLFLRLHAAAVAFLPLGPALGMDMHPDELTSTQACTTLFALIEFSTTAASLVALYWMQRQSRARFVRHAATRAALVSDEEQRQLAAAYGECDTVTACAWVAMVLPAAAGAAWGAALLAAHHFPR
jgi:hypothetical protein